MKFSFHFELYFALVIKQRVLSYKVQIVKLDIIVCDVYWYILFENDMITNIKNVSFRVIIRLNEILNICHE